MPFSILAVVLLAIRQSPSLYTKIGHYRCLILRPEQTSFVDGTPTEEGHFCHSLWLLVTSWQMIVVKSFLFIIIAPATFVVLVPWLIANYGDSDQLITDYWRFVAAPLWTVGAAVLIWCAWEFAMRGEGTPAPIDAP
ncbi:MAG: hypothetical protein ACR2O8_01000, partial [Rhizobiaceae bacterium]